MSAAEFELERCEDEYGKRAEAMIAEKVKGHEITAAPKARRQRGRHHGRVKESLAETESKRPAQASSKAKKRKACS